METLQCVFRTMNGERTIGRMRWTLQRFLTTSQRDGIFDGHNIWTEWRILNTIKRHYKRSILEQVLWWWCAGGQKGGPESYFSSIHTRWWVGISWWTTCRSSSSRACIKKSWLVIGVGGEWWDPAFSESTASLSLPLVLVYLEDLLALDSYWGIL